MKAEYTLSYIVATRNKLEFLREAMTRGILTNFSPSRTSGKHMLGTKACSWHVENYIQIIINEVGFKGNIVGNREMPEGASCKVMDDTRSKKVFPTFKFTDFHIGIRETLKYYGSI